LTLKCHDCKVEYIEAHGPGEREDEIMECRIKSKGINHSDPKTDPEMFTIYGIRRAETTVTACLAHAIIAEARGHKVDVILS
jgi:hypothetical protein